MKKKKKEEKNPMIIYDQYHPADDDHNKVREAKPSREGFIDDIESFIDCYQEDCIYDADDEDLFLYVEPNNLNARYLGYDEAKTLFKQYVRVPLLDLLSDTEIDEDGRLWDEEKIARFVDANFDASCFDENSVDYI